MRRGIGFVAAGLCTVLLAAPAPAKVDKDEVNKAVDRGVKYLKGLQRGDGTWPYDQIGATALAGLTLLECGVATDDPAVQKAARAVRHKSVGLTHTYSLALSIMFLDRLGERVDVSLIESMAVRLLAGQYASGGWSYDCPNIGEAEVRRLGKMVELRNDRIEKGEPPQLMPPGRREFKELPKEIQQQIMAVSKQRGGFGGNGGGVGNVNGDNSNTQFAILALWVARRYGIPVETALGRIQTRFRTTQNADGGWGYLHFERRMRGMPLGMAAQMGEGSSAAMTCAGLLGLALVHGAINERALKTNAKTKDQPGGGTLKPATDIKKDLHIQKGLVALGSALKVNPLKKAQDGNQRGLKPPDGVKPPGGFRGSGAPGGRGFRGMPWIDPDRSGKTYYFLWSLERVAVAYSLDTIGDKDWYTWGGEILLANQRLDGSWAGEFATYGADTCFALLFLRRANLAKDLSASLRGLVKDPKQVELKGGVGFKGIGLKPAIDPNEKSTPVDDKRKEKAPVGQVPGSNLDADTAKLSAELVDADPADQDRVLDKLRQGKGGQYSQALAAAIPQLEGKVKTKARQALADRLTRLKAKNVLQYLKDEDLELRCAAAIALGQKDDKECVGALIDALDDPEPPVARAAYRALKSLTNKDFGPSAEATRKEKAAAIKKWRDWWTKNKDK
jgi:hypothetical protein